MAISEKDRKTLWARSGNRCALCRIELVSGKDENNNNLNLGEECHIISKKQNGPRYKPDYKDNHDDYSNLILLCCNHHRMIDEQYETYTEKILHQIKLNHEKWVKSAIDSATGLKKEPRKRILPRITSGKELVDIISGMHASEFDFDELKTEEEVQLIGSFLQNLRDWGDLLGMAVVETYQSIELGFNLTKDLKEIENLGFLAFGEYRKSKMTNDKKEDLGTWKIGTIVIVRKENPNILNMGLLNPEPKI